MSTEQMTVEKQAAIVIGMLSDSAPKLAEITEHVLNNDIWQRPGLSQRERCLITIAVLIAQYRAEALDHYMRWAVDSGVSKEELAEAITHIAFYTGFPNAIGATMHLKALFENEFGS